MFRTLFFSFLFLIILAANAQDVREFGIEPGVLKPGKYNAITDVNGVKVGHITLIEGDKRYEQRS